MVEGTGLENRHTRKRIVGSNPTLSASDFAFLSSGEGMIIRDRFCIAGQWVATSTRKSIDVRSAGRLAASIAKEATA